MTDALKLKHKSRTNPQLMRKDKVVRVCQDLEAKVTGTPNASGAKDLRQLRILADIIEPAPCQQYKTDDDLKWLREELRNLIATVDPRVQYPRVQRDVTATAPRVQDPMSMEYLYQGTS